jgi:hypothetical protein
MYVTCANAGVLYRRRRGGGHASKMKDHSGMNITVFEVYVSFIDRDTFRAKGLKLAFFHSYILYGVKQDVSLARPSDRA